MFKLVLAVAIVSSFFIPKDTFAQGIIYHQGYVNQNGTYVQPHYQTAPNNTRTDNWSTQGNTNPYTGQPGHVLLNPNRGINGSY